MRFACPSCGAPLNGNPAEPCQERQLHDPDIKTVEGRRAVWERLADAAEALSLPQNAHLLTQAARALAAAEDEIAALSRAQPPADPAAPRWRVARTETFAPGISRVTLISDCNTAPPRQSDLIVDEGS